MTVLAPHAPEWHARRKQRLTASDLAAFLGQSRFKNPATVIAEKLYDLDPGPTSEAARLGQLLHPGIVAWEAERRCLGPIDTEVWCEAPNGFMGAHLDGATKPRDAAIEGKTSGLLNPWAEGDDWGEPDSDQIPREVMFQTVGEMLACPSLEVVYVPVLLVSRGWVGYIVERKGPGIAPLLEWTETEADKRWRRHVLNRDPLPDSDPPPSADVLKRFRRVPGKTVAVPADLYDQARAHRELLRAAKKASDEADSRLTAALGDAEAGECASGRVTYFEQERRGYVVEATKFRGLRFPK